MNYNDTINVWSILKSLVIGISAFFLYTVSEAFAFAMLVFTIMIILHGNTEKEELSTSIDSDKGAENNVK